MSNQVFLECDGPIKLRHFLSFRRHEQSEFLNEAVVQFDPVAATSDRYWKPQDPHTVSFSGPAGNVLAHSDVSIAVVVSTSTS
jgi:hypothetical protein